MRAGRPAAESHNPSISNRDDVREERRGEEKIEDSRELVRVGREQEEGR